MPVLNPTTTAGCPSGSSRDRNAPTVPRRALAVSTGDSRRGGAAAAASSRASGPTNTRWISPPPPDPGCGAQMGTSSQYRVCSRRNCSVLLDAPAITIVSGAAAAEADVLLAAAIDPRTLSSCNALASVTGKLRPSSACGVSTG
eukprot:30957-Pelagococcus_subviridis.AAC.89